MIGNPTSNLRSACEPMELTLLFEGKSAIAVCGLNTLPAEGFIVSGHESIPDGQ
jgi:hypothetical protein